MILVPGPADEIKTVREVYRLFVEAGRLESEIADVLNARGVRTDLGRAWTRGTVHQLLINEKYVGNNVWGRSSFKLKQARVQNSPEQWIRADGVFEPIVEKDLFDGAAQLIAARSSRLSNEEMLFRLKQVLDRKGRLSGLIIDETEDCPSSSSFRGRFGSLLRAYTLVGFAPNHDYAFVEINRALRRLHPGVVAGVVSGIEAAGGRSFQDPASDLLTINDEFSASVVIARCRETRAGWRWRIKLDTALWPDLTIAVRMAAGNESPLDYYLLPGLDMDEAVLRLCEHNGLSLDAYRFVDLEALYRMAVRVPVRRAA